MKKNLMKRIQLGAVTSLMVAATALSACGGGGGNANSVIIDFGSLMPTVNTTPTQDNPEVIQASRHLINTYSQQKGITIEWAKDYGRNPGDNIDKITSWYNTQVNTNNCPIIGFTSLNMLQELDYYVVLDEYMEKPNPYVEGNKRWKDIFYDYVWEDSSLYNIKGELVAVPILLSAGAQTGVYYNKEVFESFDIPTDWKQFNTLIEDISYEGVRPFVPYTGYTKPGLYQWAFEFNLTPNVLEKMKEVIDYDGNGTLTNMEVLRGVMEGYFDPTQEGAAKEVYRKAYDYYSETLGSYASGWGSYDYTTNWANGNVAMWDNGLWNITMENSNTSARENFDYGIFCTPLAGAETFGDYAVDTEYYEEKGFESIKNPVSVAFNVMKPAVANDPAKLELAIDILMYITAQENCSQMAIEKGGTLGAAKGSLHNTALDDEELGWVDQYFPKVSYSAKWPTGYTAEMSGKINDDFEKWVQGTAGMTESKFMSNLKENQLTGARQYIETFKIDTTGWNIV